MYKLIQKINTLIIEDDPKSSDFLSGLLSNCFDQINIVGKSDNVKDSIRLIEELKPEIIFLDIMLTDGTGFEILDNVIYKDFEVIFVTAHKEFLERALKKYPFHYALKPINSSKLQGVIGKYEDMKTRFFEMGKYRFFEQFLKDKTSKILIHVSNEYLAISIDKIIKCTADGNYTNFHLLNKNIILASNSLKHYEELLLSKGFFKIRRSTLVNINSIKSIYKKEAIILDNDEKLMISRRNKSSIDHLIKLLS